MGRKSGANAFDPVPRKFSKAQLKRKVAERERNMNKQDPKEIKKKILKSNQLKAQMTTPEFGEFIEDTEKM